MYLRGMDYMADKGKHFVLTEKGSKECASLHGYEIGKEVEDYGTYAPEHYVKEGFLAEEEDPEFCVTAGYTVGYFYNGHFLYAGGGDVYPDPELAANVIAFYKSKNAYAGERLVIRMGVYEGKRLTPRRDIDGFPVYNKSWYRGIAALPVGGLIDKEVISEYLLDAVEPAFLSYYRFQMGEPIDTVLDPTTVNDIPIHRTTYATFTRVDEDTWRYVGECFKGMDKRPEEMCLNACEKEEDREL
jgi:hypothetical protein